MQELYAGGGLRVAPFTGAWIEITGARGYKYLKLVAPFTGAWIEIEWSYRPGPVHWSLPSRERGLK